MSLPGMGSGWDRARCWGQTQGQHPDAVLQEITWVLVTHFLKHRKHHLPRSSLPLQPFCCTLVSFSTAFHDLLAAAHLGNLSPSSTNLVPGTTPTWLQLCPAVSMDAAPWSLGKCRCYLAFSSRPSQVLRAVPGSAATSHR